MYFFIFLTYKLLRESNPLNMKSETISILSTLSIEENKKLKHFLNGKYFSHNKNVKSLLNELLKFYPAYNLKIPDKENIYKKIYKSGKYNDSTFRSLMHNLYLILQEFVIFENLKKNRNDKILLLLDGLNKRGETDVFNKQLNSINKEMQSNQYIISSNNYLSRYKLSLFSYNFNKSLQRINKGTQVNNQLNSIEKSNYILTLFYLIEIISDYVNKQIHYRKYSVSIPEKIEILDCIDFNSLNKFFKNTEHFPIFNLYVSLLKLFKNFKEEQNYFNYKTALLKIETGVDKNELIFHYNSLISYCIIKKNLKNNDKFKIELWNLYSVLLDKELYLTNINQYLDTGMFRSILFLGLELGYYDKVKNFINNYSIKVCPSEVNNMYNLGFSYYNYYIKKYDLALKNLSKISLNDFIYKYDIKNLYIKIYLENEHLDSLESILKSYTKFLKKDKLLNVGTIQSISNFICYCNKYITLKEKDDIEVSYEIKQLQKSEVYSKDWLIKMYSNLLAKKAAANQ